MLTLSPIGNSNKTGSLLRDNKSVLVDTTDVKQREAPWLFGCAQSQDNDWQISHILLQLCVTGSLKACYNQYIHFEYSGCLANELVLFKDWICVASSGV